LIENIALFQVITPTEFVLSLTRGMITPPALVAIANDGTTGAVADEAIRSFGLYSRLMLVVPADPGTIAAPPNVAES
jgi:hypothetical protein